MEFRELEIEGAWEILPKIFRDARGSFSTVYDKRPFAERSLVVDWVCDNQSTNTERGIVRGIHFQKPPHAQTKLVRAVSGRALDLLVDLRTDSSTYLKAIGIELDADSGNTVYIPKGCGHAYLTLTEGVIIQYKVDAYYAPESEGGVRWDDPMIGFKWPIEQSPILSVKDEKWPLMGDWENPFRM